MAGRFQFVSKDYIDFRVRDRIPKNTQKNTNWGVNTWNLWVTARNNARQLGQPKFPCAMELEFISPQEMNEYLCHFVLKDELNRPDLNLYNPNNVYFNRFRQTLDSQMKLVTEKGIGTVKRQAQPITEEQEKFLWDKGLLSINDAVGLSKIVYFYNCKVFGLRSRDEHNNLQAEQYTFSSDEAGNFVLYQCRASKITTGGLNQRKVSLKQIKQYDTGNNLCVYRVFKKYLDLIGNGGYFYRKPLEPLYEGHINFSSDKLSSKTLSSYIGNLMKQAGFEGRYTGHSGKVTLATTLYQSGVDEQLIKERTGHRSEAARQYKRTSSEQQKYISRLVDIPTSLLLDNAQVEPISYNYIHKKFRAQEYVENKNDMPNFDIGYSFE